MTKPNPRAVCRNCGFDFLKKTKRQVICSPLCALNGKTDKRGPDECWPWRGKFNNRGYGQLTFNGKHFYAHRLALHLVLGVEPDRWVFACHTCDNPWCVNPNHLFAGTPRDNSQDGARKGRVGGRPPLCLGERHGQSKLTHEAVLAIRASDDSPSVLAKRYGVGVGAISKVRLRERWAHV